MLKTKLPRHRVSITWASGWRRHNAAPYLLYCARAAAWLPLYSTFPFRGDLTLWCWAPLRVDGYMMFVPRSLSPFTQPLHARPTPPNFTTTSIKRIVHRALREFLSACRQRITQRRRRSLNRARGVFYPDEQRIAAGVCGKTKTLPISAPPTTTCARTFYQVVSMGIWAGNRQAWHGMGRQDGTGAKQA